MSASSEAAQVRVALVTGASRGIGRAIALALAAQGHTVVGTATTAGGAEKISAYLAEHGAKGEGMALDVASDDSVAAVTEAVTSSYEAPTILVNNAGITRDNIMLRMKPDEWSDVLETNLSSLYRMTRASLKGMTRARWGRIINISSVVGRMGNAGQVNYAASKAGIEGFTRALAREIGSRSITVNAVAPGFIQTDMTDALSDEQKAAMSSQIPLARLGTADEIASVVGFLSSDAAAYITGETINVNGGMYMA